MSNINRSGKVYREQLKKYYFWICADAQMKHKFKSNAVKSTPPSSTSLFLYYIQFMENAILKLAISLILLLQICKPRGFQSVTQDDRNKGQ
jgi:hypothetical protein